MPPGLIAYMRVDADDVERYFTVNSLGDSELALFETTGCACIRWSGDGTELWTVAETESGLRFKTMDPDGGNEMVYVPDIETLNLVPGFGSADGKHLGLFGWDDTDPSRQGLWVAKTDLAGLHQVSALPEGSIAIEPIGMSHDGSFVYFLGDLGEEPENIHHHAGNVYVVASDGTGLRQLNPKGTRTQVTGTGVSADGRQFAFTAWQAGAADQGNALFVVDGPDGEAERVTDWTVGLWGASWAPGGEWIGYSSEDDARDLISLIRPDGSETRAVVPADTSETVSMPVWSPDGTHLLVRRGDQHGNDLWIMDLDGAFVWQVTHEPASLRHLRLGEPDTRLTVRPAGPAATQFDRPGRGRRRRERRLVGSRRARSARRPTRYQVSISPLPLTVTVPRGSQTNSSSRSS